MTENITVVGAGVSGRALALFAARHGARVFVTEGRERLLPETEDLFAAAGVRWECGGHTPRCCDCGLMLVGSGVSERSPAVVMARERGIPVQGELDFLAPFWRGTTIAVTGTNGKTTCTSLIAHILRENGLAAAAAGNIGVPLAAVAERVYKAVVMELSSFQLHWNTRFAPDIAVLTNLAPDHIDWHGSFENYAADKCRVFLPGAAGGWAVVHAGDVFRVPRERRTVALGRDDCGIVFENDAAVLVHAGQRRTLFNKSALPMIGIHNLENAAMSAAAAVLAFPHVDAEGPLRSFVPPRHRCEKVCVKSGVLYVDDSKGTNVAAAVTALKSVPGRKVVILGGQGKGESYEALADAVKQHAFAAVVIGTEAPAIRAALERQGCTGVFGAADMEAAVVKAAQLARTGDTVLLSPACTSWDMYKNFEERGDHFAAIVRSLV